MWPGLRKQRRKIPHLAQIVWVQTIFLLVADRNPNRGTAEMLPHFLEEELLGLRCKRQRPIHLKDEENDLKISQSGEDV